MRTLEFEDTVLAREKGNLQLRTRDGELLFELRSGEIDDAVRCGYLDPDNPHFSMFQHLRMLRDVSHGGSVTGEATGDSPDRPDDDTTFLRRIGIRWD